MNTPPKSSPESPAKEQPGEQKWTPLEEWKLVPSRANVRWSASLKSKYPGYSNYELQQMINKILDAAPPPPERP